MSSIPSFMSNPLVYLINFLIVNIRSPVDSDVLFIWAIHAAYLLSVCVGRIIDIILDCKKKNTFRDLIIGQYIAGLPYRLIPQ